jgi:hypothetical protein
VGVASKAVGVEAFPSAIASCAARRFNPGVLAFLIPLAAYLSLAWLLAFQWHHIVGDAWSRVGNAYYVLFSRDPHLAAIGFVWGPLPAVSTMPLLLFKDFWPGLVKEGFAGNITSAIFMAAAVYQVWVTLEEWKLAIPSRLGLTTLFAAHPMTLHYAANGNSEALFLLLLIVAVRRLARWLRSNEPGEIVVASFALALAYLTRYETALVAASVVAGVFLVTAYRHRGRLGSRLVTASADALIVSAPVALAFGAWTFASWLIVGHPFEQFASPYGTTAQLEVGRSLIAGVGTPAAVTFVAGQLLILEPFLVVLVALALLVAARRRDLLPLVPLAVLGSVLAFAIVAWLTGRTGGFIRYYITEVPLATLLAGAVLARMSPTPVQRSPQSARPQPGRRQSLFGRGGRRRLSTAALVVVVGLVAAALPFSAAQLFDSELGRGEASQLAEVRLYLASRHVAAEIDEMDLPDGVVLMDVFLGFGVALSSDHPQQFVITPDRDFQAALVDPAGAGVRYLLVPAPVGPGRLDAMNREWPTLYESGAGLATLVREFPAPSYWRLYAVDR